MITQSDEKNARAFVHSGRRADAMAAADTRRSARASVAFRPLIALIAIVSLGCAPTWIDADAQRRPHRPSLEASEELERAFARLPIRFEENRGQVDARVKFLSRGVDHTLWLTTNEAIVAFGRRGASADNSLSPGDVSSVLAMRFLGGNRHLQVTGLKRLPGVTNYLNAKHRERRLTGIPSYARIRYREVYPGIDLAWHGDRGRLEYDFVVAPGADPKRIRLAFRGARGAHVDRRGDLVLPTRTGELRHKRPQIYQELDGDRRPVDGGFLVTKNGIGFRVGKYDPARPLVIDPVLAYSSFLGGAQPDQNSAIALDGAGNIYLAGHTTSTNFPTAAPLQPASRGQDDAFVAKLNPSGSALIYSTYLGGAGVDRALGLALDPSGSAYVAGQTTSTDFPTASPIQAGFGGGANDGFIAKLNPSGSALIYSTYLGGAGVDRALAIAVHEGAAYITGETSSTDFPLASPLQGAKGAGAALDAFVAKLNPAGSALAYSTYLGGGDVDAGAGIEVDGSGSAYVTGRTVSADFPTASPIQAAKGAGPFPDAFVAKLNPAGSALAYSTYLGGSDSDSGAAIELDPSNNAYITGETSSPNFPTARAMQAARGGESDAFVAKLNPAGSALVYSTYLGGRGADSGLAIALEGGAPHVTGSVTSGTFPTVMPVAKWSGNNDVFVSKLDAEASRLLYSTYLGSNGGDRGLGIAVRSGTTYVAGSTAFTATNDFPVSRPMQATYGGGFQSGNQAGDGFLARIVPTRQGQPVITGLSPRTGTAAGGSVVEITGTGFRRATRVRFGRTPAASYRVRSDRRITAVSPSGSGFVQVTVATSRGTTAQNPVSRFYFGRGAWSSAQPSRDSHFAHTTTLLPNGKVLVAGGRSTASGPVVAAAELYDPRTGRWTAADSLETARWSHRATLLPNGKVLVTGGFTDPNAVLPTATAELYDPATDRWSPAAPLAEARALHDSTLLPNGTVLVTGGRQISNTALVRASEVYNPATNTWTTTGALATGRYIFESAVLNNGRVLVAGGFGGGGAPLPLAELYDPATGTWTTAGGLSTPHARPTLTPLRNGKVLLAGGFASEVGAVRTTELYDPATGTWQRTGDLNFGRWNHTATMLPNGSVLVIGGGTGGSSAEVYDPATGVWRLVGLTNTAHSSSGGSAGTGGTAVVLSSNPRAFERDRRICGPRCGKVLILGNNDDRSAELWDPVARTAASSIISLSHSLNPHAFSGRVSSASRACMGGREVVINRTRSGRDEVVGRARTNASGTWRIPHRRAGAGSYYATSKSRTVRVGGDTLVCRATRSRAISVPR